MNFLARFASLSVLLLLPVFSLNAQIITTFAGTHTPGFTPDGYPAYLSKFNYPNDVTTDTLGNVYIADGDNAVVRKVDTFGNVYIFAGNGTEGYSGDGNPAALGCQVGRGLAIAMDLAGNMFIADGMHFVARKINTAGIISTFAGNGTCDYTGDGGPAVAARVCTVGGIAVQGSGSDIIYLSEGIYSVIRRVATSGIISTCAGWYGFGSPGYTGDGGPATDALMHYPGGVAVDAGGNLYIADQANAAVRKVSTAGIITTVAGNHTSGYSGDGGPATSASLLSPVDVAVDAAGSLFILDQGANVIRKVNTAGIISTYVGNGTSGYSGDGGPAVLAQIKNASGICTDKHGNLFIADKDNHVIRKVAATTNHAPSFAAGPTFNVCINAINASLSAALTVNDADAGQTEQWSIVAGPTHGTLNGFSGTAVTSGGTAVPTGLTYTPVLGYTGTDTFRIMVSDSFNVAYDTVYVNVLPYPNAGTVGGPATVCTGASVTLVDAVAGGTWIGTNSRATVDASGLVTGVTPGGDTIIYTVTNGCSLAIATHIITVIPSPGPGVITGADTVCNGAAITLADATTGGIWSSANGSASVAAGVVTALYVGVDTIRYTVTSGVCASSALHKVVINDIPDPMSITGPAFVCLGSAITLAEAATGTWSCTNGNATISATGIVNGVSAGIDSVVYTVANSCGTSYAYLPVAILAAPATAGTISGDDHVCIDFSDPLTADAPGGVWSSDNTFIATISASGLVTGVSTGTAQISYTITNACGTASTTFTVDVGSDIYCANGVHDIHSTAGIGIYPNPNAGVFTIHWSTNIRGNARVLITDPAGRKILELETVTDRATEIKLDASAGIYFIAAKTGGGDYNAKVTVY